MIALLLVQTTVSPLQTPPRDCPVQASQSEDGGEIVVCADRDSDERYRLRPIPPRYVESREIGIGIPGVGRLEPRVEQGRLGDPQIKMTLKIPY